MFKNTSYCCDYYFTACVIAVIACVIAVVAACVIKTHSSISVAKKTKEDLQHTSVLFTGTIKLPNSAFHISKPTKPISITFIYFMPYIYTTSHIKIEGYHFNTS